MRQYDWSTSQRQPLAGLTIVFLDTLWEVFKRAWPFLILMLFGESKEGKVNRYEILAMGLLVFTIIGAVFRFLYFRFYIEDAKLIIKHGWLKKETKVIPLERIQTVNIEQGPLHQLLNIVKLSIDTAGSEKAEAKIDALHKTMAEALRMRLIADKRESSTDEQNSRKANPILTLTDKDLFKLSISANHVETFFLFLSFVFGLYENFKDIDNSIFSNIQDFLPKNVIYPFLFLTVAILLITIVLSTARIFFKFYRFTVFSSSKGFQIKSGLFNIKERLITFQKIQFISWKASWIRKLFGLWMLEYHVAGADETSKNLKVQLPVTQAAYIPLLVKDYHDFPQITNQIHIRIHPSFIVRRLLMVGLLPALFILPLLWALSNAYALFFLLYPAIIFIVALCTQRKFRLWALEDACYIKKGVFGEERILFEWHKLQSIQIRQSIYQRRKNLASVDIQTAGGNIAVHFIPLAAARQVVNFALYKTEVANKSWL